MMDLKKFMDITPEIEEAVAAGKPVVALESTILSHGMPYPENLGFAREIEKLIRAELMPEETEKKGFFSKLRSRKNAED